MDDEIFKRLSDMIHYAELAMRDVDANSAETFLDNELEYLGRVNALQNIGEAASQLRRTHPQVLKDIDLDWERIIAFRNQLVHNYPNIVPAIIFAIIRESLPPMVQTLRARLELN